MNVGVCCKCFKNTRVYLFGSRPYCKKCKPKKYRKPEVTMVDKKYKKIEKSESLEVEHVCEECGKVFIKKENSNKKYCSVQCQSVKTKLAVRRGRFIIFERDDFTCFYCGKKSYTDGLELHVDHVIPQIKNGSSRADNLVTSCGSCNVQKGSMVIRNQMAVLEEIKRRNCAAGICDDTIIKAYAPIEPSELIIT